MNEEIILNNMNTLMKIENNIYTLNKAIASKLIYLDVIINLHNENRSIISLFPIQNLFIYTCSFKNIHIK